MATQNNITTKSYLVKRLKDSGYDINKLDNIVYDKNDKRKFSILLDNGGNSIIITVYKDEKIEMPDGKTKTLQGKIQFYDGGRIHNAHLNHRTESVEVIYEYLNEKGVVNKHYTYLARKPIYGTDGKFLHTLNSNE